MITNARIWYDDDNDPANPGWWGTYYTDGDERQIDSIDGTRDESIESLATQVAAALDHLDERVTVRVGTSDRPRGTITVEAGRVIDWRAL